MDDSVKTGAPNSGQVLLCDIAIFGASVGAVCLARRLARAGRRVLLCAANGFLGGSLSGGLATWRTPHEALDPEAAELIDAAVRRLPLSDPGSFHPESLKLVLDEAVSAETAIQLRFHTRPTHALVDGDRLVEVEVHSKSGFERVRAATFVDASGTGSLARLAPGDVSNDTCLCVGRALLGSVSHVSARQAIVPSFNTFSVQFADTEDRPGSATKVRASFDEGRRQKTMDVWVNDGSGALVGGGVELGEGVVWTERRMTLRFVWQRSDPPTAFLRKLVAAAVADLKGRVPGFEEAYLMQVANEVSRCPLALAADDASVFDTETEASDAASRAWRGARFGERVIVTAGVASPPCAVDELRTPGLAGLYRLPDDLWFNVREGAVIEDPALSIRSFVLLSDALLAERGASPESISRVGVRRPHDEEAGPEPVWNYDVAVVGGGVSGVAAAVAAARHGARVVLIEQSGDLGGNGTTGGVTSFAGGARGGIYDEVLTELHRLGAKFPNNQAFDPEMFRLVLDRMVEAAGVDVWFGATLWDVCREGARITGARVFRSGGRHRVRAAFFVDCSGDAEVAHAAGLPTLMGRAADSLTQPVSLMYQVAMDAGYRHLDFFWKLPRGRFLINATRIPANGTMVDHLTRAEVEGRRQMWMQMDSLRRQYDYRLVQSGPRVGIRETRRIDGLYTLNQEDVIEGRHFDDRIGNCDYFLDIHNPTGKRGTVARKVPCYDIPFRCLVPKDADNLLAAGRCVSMTHEAMASLRVMPPCFIIGQGAGTAAALALRAGTTVPRLNIRLLQAALEADGIDLTH